MKHPLNDLTNLLRRPVETAAHSGLFEKQPDSGHSDVLEIYHFTTTLVYA